MTTLIATSTWYAKARVRTESGVVANEVMSLILSRNAGAGGWYRSCAIRGRTS